MRMSEFPEPVSKNIIDRFSERITTKFSEEIPGWIIEGTLVRFSEGIPEGITNQVNERL